MLRASKVVALLLLLGSVSLAPSSRVLAASQDDDAAANKPSPIVSLKPASAIAPDIPFGDYDAQAEQLLLYLANQARAQFGAPRLTLDAGMSRAARMHAEKMVAERQLSHRLEGEPSLPQRLAAETRTQLDQEGENVAFDFDAAQGHQHLMQSPPHRATCLTRPITWSG